MEQAVAKLMTKQVVQEGQSRFSCDFGEIKPLGDFENYVYEVSKEGTPHILRLTHCSHRTIEMVEAELDWLNHLSKHGVSVAMAIRSNHDRLGEVIETGDSYFIASLFEKAPGHMVTDQTGEWGVALFEEWGRTIGKMHQATTQYQSTANIAKRPFWYENDLVVNFSKYIPIGQNRVREKAKKHFTLLKKLPCESNQFGLIHGDVHSGNFFVQDGKRITVFDFDDTEFHWFVSDIAISLYYSLWWTKDVDHQTFAKTYMKAFLKGYRKEYDLDQEWIARIPIFMRLRDILLYAVFHKKMDLDKMGERQKKLIDDIRNRIEKNIPVVDIDFSQL